jgi:phage terminase small subunit
MMADLNDKQLAFCREYIVDLNSTQAAIRAGYSDKTAGAIGSRLLKNVKVEAEIKRLMDQRSERTNVTADDVVRQLAKIAFLDMRDIVDWGMEKRERKDGSEYMAEYVRPRNAEEVDGTLIQSVKMGKFGFEIMIPDRMRAMEMLAKHLGVYDDRPQTTVSIEPYKKALWERAQAGDVWAGFNNGGPDPGGEDDGKD